MTFSNATFRISLSACALWLVTGPAHAVDLNSQDLIPAPAGTDAVLGYFSYATRDSFTPTGAANLSEIPGSTPSSASFVTSTTWTSAALWSRRRCCCPTDVSTTAH
jgi:hypothetical protein